MAPVSLPVPSAFPGRGPHHGRGSGSAHATSTRTLCHIYTRIVKTHVEVGLSGGLHCQGVTPVRTRVMGNKTSTDLAGARSEPNLRLGIDHHGYSHASLNKGFLKRSKKRRRMVRSMSTSPAETPRYDTPDVETLALPFHVCARIFVHLSLRDLASCMLVCKEWRSLIDTCWFLRFYLRSHFDTDPIVGSGVGPVLSRWEVKSESDTAQNVDVGCVFTRFPIQWKCGIVLPSDAPHPEGNIDVYHAFLQAVSWLSRVREKIRDSHLSNRVEVCMLNWTRDRLPLPKEVLQIFHVNTANIHTHSASKELTKQELFCYYGILTKRHNGCTLDSALYHWLISITSGKSIVFDCSCKTWACPTMGFFFTKLSTDWIGGLIYSI